MKMKKIVRLDIRDWWELMDGIESWAILFETMAQCDNSHERQTDEATNKKAQNATDVSLNYRRIVSEIERQIGETGYHPGLSGHLRLLR